MAKKIKVSGKKKRKVFSKKKATKVSFGSIIPLFGKSALRASALLLVVLLNWSGLSAIGKTAAYLIDTEESLGNTFIAGTLDFELAIPFDFPSSAIEIGGNATKTIDLVNLGNIHKYKVRADNFSGELCDYLTLEANLDGDTAEYIGSLTSFDWGYATFTEPESWNFTLTLSSTTPETLIGETCNFDFVFWGSQTRHDLPFGMGFNDEEQEDNSVKAQICYDAQTRSMGYWKTHSDAYKSYLPQYLGCNATSSECIGGYDEIGSKTEANQIFNADNSIMRNKLKKQLLAMKFNIAHFKIGEYTYATLTDNFNTIVGQADVLLQQTPAPSNEVLEEMKNLLESLNQDLEFRTCSDSFVRVIVPNGGEVYWVGHYVDLIWTSHNLECSTDSLASIWYSNDSGTTWGNIATGTENDGIYNWRIPLYLENGTYYVPSGNARIKVVTRCSETLLTNGWDMSDEDFCPPIDYDLLLPEEIEALKAMGMLPEDFIPQLAPEIIPDESSTATDETSSTTEEIVIEENIGVGGNEPIIPTNETTVESEEIIPEGITTEEIIIEDSVIGELPVEEILTEEPMAQEPLAEDPMTDEIPADEQLSPMNQEDVAKPEVVESPIIVPTEGADSGSSGEADSGNIISGTETAAVSAENQ